MIVPLPDLESVTRLGQQIADRLHIGDIVALSGDLGAGKTTLSRAILRARGHRGEVPSPTYTLLETYDLPGGPIVHADFYRLDEPRQLEELGLDDYRDSAILLAEWPENAGGFEEPVRLAILLENTGGSRRAIVEGGSAWHGRMP